MSNATCRGSYALGTACGNCQRCTGERAGRMTAAMAQAKPAGRMEPELWAAGLSLDDAKFAARMLRQEGYYLVKPDDLGFEDIKAFRDEMARGQNVREDAGGFFLRGIKRLLRLPTGQDEVTTYQDAARAFLEEHAG